MLATDPMPLANREPPRPRPARPQQKQNARQPSSLVTEPRSNTEPTAVRSNQFASNRVRVKAPEAAVVAHKDLATVKLLPNGTKVFRRRRPRPDGVQLQKVAAAGLFDFEANQKASNENQEISSSRRTEVVYQNNVDTQKELLKQRRERPATTTVDPAVTSTPRKSRKFSSASRAVENDLVAVKSTTSPAPAASTTQARRPTATVRAAKSSTATTTVAPAAYKPVTRGTTRNLKATSKPKLPNLEDLQDENYPEHYKLSLKAKLDVKQQSNEVTDIVERPRPTNRPVAQKAARTTTTTSTTTTRNPPTQRVTFPKLNRPTEAPSIRQLDDSGILPSAAGDELSVPTHSPAPKYSSRIRQNDNRAQEPSHKLRPRSQNPVNSQRNSPNFLDSTSSYGGGVASTVVNNSGQGRGMPTATVSVAREELIAPVI